MDEGHPVLIREVDVGAAFLSMFTPLLFVNTGGAGSFSPAPFFCSIISGGDAGMKENILSSILKSASLDR